jgi:hypothetical protein
MKTTITIQAIRPPGEGKKSACITTTTNEKLWLWADKLGLVNVGATYEVITEENKGFTNIKTLKEVARAAASVVPLQPRQRAAAADAPFRTPETLFVQGLLEHYIDNGQCPPTELIRYINAIRFAWQRTLGETGPFVSGGGSVPYDQAAE